MLNHQEQQWSTLDVNCQLLTQEMLNKIIMQASRCDGPLPDVMEISIDFYVSFFTITLFILK